MKRVFVLLLMTLLYCSLPVRANTLPARVVEVHDGKTITVENTGRLIKVTLKIADAPERNQPFGDAARQHLAGLILGRQVTVEYTGLGAGAMLIARVFCDERDIGLQMIRDGAAWYDRRLENELSAAERLVYSDSEQAARNERRGIWQEAAPVPPWEWRRKSSQNRASYMSVTAPKKTVTAGAAISGQAPRQDTTLPSLSNRRAAATGWPPFSPSGNPFSIRIPRGGGQYSTEVDVPNGSSINANFYWVNHLKIKYIVVWASGPSQGQAVSALYDQALAALNDAASAQRLPCEFFQEKDVAMRGYTGRRYRVRGCYLNGGIRYYTKVEGRTLKLRFVGVMSEIPGDPAINQFLESFIINEETN